MTPGFDYAKQESYKSFYVICKRLPFANDRYYFLNYVKGDGFCEDPYNAQHFPSPSTATGRMLRMQRNGMKNLIVLTLKQAVEKENDIRRHLGLTLLPIVRAVRLSTWKKRLNHK